ncbi:MAG TPA: hypothetical protein VGJ84_11150, partial [Polyangiaceae bacterium]
LGLAFGAVLYKRGDFATGINTMVPELLFPTSNESRHNGTILGLGARVTPSQTVPLFGSGADFLRTLTLSGIARYRHVFTRAEVPTNPSLNQIRTDVDGVPVVSDQLGEAAFAEHQARFGFDVGVEVLERLTFSTRFEWRPAWKYRFAEVQVCNLLTGCVTPSGVQNPQTYQVATLFYPSLTYDLLDELSLTAGYLNLANQIGPDGKRRNMFYSPDARFELAVSLHLDQLYKTVTSPARSQSSAAGTARRGSASPQF